MAATMQDADPHQAAACKLTAKLSEAGFRAFLAGGCVRDAIRGKTPSDYDVATDARVEQVAELFPGAKLVGAHFGVAIVRFDDFEFEVATFRSDGSYGDGRRPDTVEFSTPEHDAQRRDFTMNGIFFDPIAGEYIDHVGGQEDIKAELVRAIGDPSARFGEDHLRMLRAVRFAARFGFEIESGTWEAIQSGAPLIAKISAERTRDEVSKILLDKNKVRGFDLLVESGLMAQIVPEILDLKGCEQPPQFHPEGDVFVHTRLMLSLLEVEQPSLALVWSVLLHDIGKPATYTFEEGDRIRFNGHDKVGAEMAEAILRRMKYPNELIDDVCVMVANHMVFKDVQKMRTSKVKRIMARETYRDEMELHRVDCLGSWGGLDNYEFMHAKEEEFANAPIIPPRLVDGRDLLDLGWKAGPAMGETLREIQDLQLEGKLTTKEEALEWLAKNAKP